MGLIKELPKEEVESFIYKLEDDLYYAIEHYCPDDEKLRELRRQIMEKKDAFLMRLRELVKEKGMGDDEEIQQVLDEC